MPLLPLLPLPWLLLVVLLLPPPLTFQCCHLCLFEHYLQPKHYRFISCKDRSKPKMPGITWNIW